MTNGTASKGVTLDELLQGMNGRHGSPLPRSGGANPSPGPSPAQREREPRRCIARRDRCTHQLPDRPAVYRRMSAAASGA